MGAPVSVRAGCYVSRMGLRILYVGEPSGTCAQRRRAFEALGHQVHFVLAGEPAGGLQRQIYRLGHHLSRPPDLLATHAGVEQAVQRQHFDVLWMDKGRTLKPSLLRSVRQRLPDIEMVSYSPDDMTLPYHSSVRYRACLPLLDLIVTTKSYIAGELKDLGARRVLFIGNAYEPDVHRPVVLTHEERERFGCEVGFIGTYEEDRAGHLLQLAEAGVPVTVRGYGWRRFEGRHPRLQILEGHLGQEDYVKVINATGINLGFLRKGARDQQTTRSVEIPGCRGFLLAERTEEHEGLFREGEEAEFFASFEELLRKCRRYLADPEARERVAAGGFERCQRDGYSNQARLEWVLAELAAPTARGG